MSAYNNRHYIAGNVGQDPKKLDAGGHTLAKFSVGVFRSGKGAAKKTDWIPCVAWHDTARGILANIKQGDAVMIMGSFTIDNIKNKDNDSYSNFYTLTIDTIGKQIFGIEKEKNGGETADDPF